MRIPSSLHRGPHQDGSPHAIQAGRVGRPGQAAGCCCQARAAITQRGPGSATHPANCSANSTGAGQASSAPRLRQVRPPRRLTHGACRLSQLACCGRLSWRTGPRPQVAPPTVSGSWPWGGRPGRRHRRRRGPGPSAAQAYARPPADHRPRASIDEGAGLVAGGASPTAARWKRPRIQMGSGRPVQMGPD
jgi:hypothetical protein